MRNRILGWTWLLCAALLVATLPGGCIPQNDPDLDELTDEEDEALFVASSTVWPSPTISVCWVNAGPQDAAAMWWTQDAVQKTWEAVSQVRFVGWGPCNGATSGVRILIADENPYSYVGTGANYSGQAHSMLLNHSFANWSQVCQNQLEHCIRTIAVHEFGHALGFDHEQNRPDSPEWCAQDAFGSGDTVIGPWDLDSVMNYCNPQWSGDGTLSAIDIQGVQQIYGASDGGGDPGCGSLSAGMALGAGQSLTSCDGRFELAMQGDGNLVLYQAGVGALWASNTWGTSGSSAVMQGDGNFVLYDAGGAALWASGTYGHDGARLAMQDDGNLVVYAANGAAIWASNTCCR